MCAAHSRVRLQALALHLASTRSFRQVPVLLLDEKGCGGGTPHSALGSVLPSSRTSHQATAGCYSAEHIHHIPRRLVLVRLGAGRRRQSVSDYNSIV